MDHILTFNNIYLSDVDTVGQRAIDLATLQKRHFNVPLGFVIDADALERFMDYNDLEDRAERWLQNDDFATLVEQTTKGELPVGVEQEVKEAYDSLTLKDDDADALVEDESNTPVTIIPSPNYTTENHMIKTHVSGTDAVLQGVKEAWASLLTEEAFDERLERDITEFYAGTIILHTPSCKTSATASTRPDQEAVIVTTRFGEVDFHDDITTDRFEVDKATLTINEHNVNQQKNKIEQGEHVQFGRGGQQTIDDKTIIELGRLTKKMSNQLDTGITAHYSLDDDINVVLVDRILQQDWFDIDVQGEAAMDEDMLAGAFKTSTEQHPRQPLLDELQEKVDELEEQVLNDEPYESELQAVEDLLRRLRT